MPCGLRSRLARTRPIGNGKASLFAGPNGKGLEQTTSRCAPTPPDPKRDKIQKRLHRSTSQSCRMRSSRHNLQHVKQHSRHPASRRLSPKTSCRQNKLAYWSVETGRPSITCGHQPRRHQERPTVATSSFDASYLAWSTRSPPAAARQSRLNGCIGNQDGPLFY